MEKISTFVTAFHESIFLYALALNETIAEGFSSANGSVITRKMWNRTYSGDHH
jgi:atrial natriuretic peptide receptor A